MNFLYFGLALSGCCLIGFTIAAVEDTKQISPKEKAVAWLLLILGLVLVFLGYLKLP